MRDVYRGIGPYGGFAQRVNAHGRSDWNARRRDHTSRDRILAIVVTCEGEAVGTALPRVDALDRKELLGKMHMETGPDSTMQHGLKCKEQGQAVVWAPGNRNR